MSDEDLAVLKRALITEGIGLTVMGIMLWYLGPGRLWLSGLAHRARTMRGNRASHIDTQVRQFAGEVSRWDHEQAARAHQKPGGGGPCGCG